LQTDPNDIYASEKSASDEAMHLEADFLPVATNNLFDQLIPLPDFVMDDRDAAPAANAEHFPTPTQEGNDYGASSSTEVTHPIDLLSIPMPESDEDSEAEDDAERRLIYPVPLPEAEDDNNSSSAAAAALSPGSPIPMPDSENSDDSDVEMEDSCKNYLSIVLDILTVVRHAISAPSGRPLDGLFILAFPERVGLIKFF
jgi:hypothetical protein